MMTFILKTLFGEARVMLGDPDADGKRGGYLARCEFSDNSPAVNAVEAMIVAHACAGIDIESDAYIEGINTTLEAISNWDEDPAENTNDPEEDHTVITAGTHDIDAEIKFNFNFTEHFNERLQEEPMSVEEIADYVYDDIVDNGSLNDCMRNLRNYLSVKVRPITQKESPEEDG